MAVKKSEKPATLKTNVAKEAKASPPTTVTAKQFIEK